MTLLTAAPQAVYIAFEAFPRPKGSCTHIAAMVEALAERFSRVLLLCCGFGEMPAVQREGPVTILRHKGYHPNLLRRAAEFGAFVHHHLSRLPHPPETIFYRDPWSGVPAQLACPDVPAVFEVNALPSWELPYTHPHVLHNHAFLEKIAEMERVCLRSARIVMTVSEVTRTALINLGVPAERILVIPNSAAEAFFRDSPPEHAIERVRSGRWIGYYGSLHSWQGLEILLKAWKWIEVECSDTALLVIHGGQKQNLAPLKEIIRRLRLKERTVLHAALPMETLAPTISRLEFTVSPLAESLRNTAQGCCPLKIIESMAAGTPVIAADLRVTRDLIRHDQDGILFPAGNVRALAHAMAGLLNDPNRRQALARGARESARDRFSPEVQRRNLNALLDRLPLFQVGRTV